MGYTLRKHYSCQKFVKTDGFEVKYLFPGTMENAIIGLDSYILNRFEPNLDYISH